MNRDNIRRTLLRICDDQPVANDLRRQARAWLIQQLSKRRGRPSNDDLAKRMQTEYWLRAIPAIYGGKKLDPIIKELEVKFGLSRSQVRKLLSKMIPDDDCMG